MTAVKSICFPSSEQLLEALLVLKLASVVHCCPSEREFRHGEAMMIFYPGKRAEMWGWVTPLENYRKLDEMSVHNSQSTAFLSEISGQGSNDRALTICRAPGDAVQANSLLKLSFCSSSLKARSRKSCHLVLRDSTQALV